MCGYDLGYQNQDKEIGSQNWGPDIGFPKSEFQNGPNIKVPIQGKNTRD